MYKLRVRAHFEAGHYLPWHPKCKEQHGHTYYCQFVVGSEQLNENGIVMDLSVLGAICRGIVGQLDHTNLNDSFENPTVEVVSEWLYQGLAEALKAGEYKQVGVVEVIVREGAGGEVVYDG